MSREEQASPDAAAGQAPAKGTATGRRRRKAEAAPASLPFCASARPCPHEQAVTCEVRRRGKNCWEVDGAPCCGRDRRLCVSCELYVEYLRSHAVPHQVKVWLTNGVELSGVIHVDGIGRLSDFLNRCEMDFIPVTEAHVHWSDDQPSADEVEVLLVRASSIHMILPLDSGFRLSYSAGASRQGGR